jgi:hypothetical protein
MMIEAIDAAANASLNPRQAETLRAAARLLRGNEKSLPTLEAAAPALLQACKMAEVCGTEELWPVTEGLLMDTLRKAIAKAEPPATEYSLLEAAQQMLTAVRAEKELQASRGESIAVSLQLAANTLDEVIKKEIWPGKSS